ncbi:DUF86 domain-containing protein [Halobacillus yeomjeoni]|uniref:DUF86 domain-containing protein n=1 Tax=Halobacillus yeomjeoni TaxID=311194 RepID=A0A931HX56_9BACI|nr:DUF86 domain-containing protein [Halobacillus yeomjeoni]MBH0231036.1 DUF86 domain-containing protein [Halobacillus yeomjeoni]MCA0984520.1 DUF86 domain-containing protein [Halobacillus yeomjeoni]
MYFVDREKIEQILQYMEKVLHSVSSQKFNDFNELLALERMTHINIEAIIDVGNMMIDGFIMRDPGSYEDIIDILTDEQVLPEEEMENYKSFIRLRKSVVQHYDSIDHEELKKVWNEQMPSIEAFPNRIRDYLTNELGPVSAFSK